MIAGAVASAVFASSTLPMLAKARRTKDVRSYSPTNIALANIGNLVYMIYVLDLPPGPIWALHLFHTLSSALMLIWYVRYVVLAERVSREPALETDSDTSVVSGALRHQQVGLP